MVEQYWYPETCFSREAAIVVNMLAAVFYGLFRAFVQRLTHQRTTTPRKMGPRNNESDSDRAQEEGNRNPMERISWSALLSV